MRQHTVLLRRTNNQQGEIMSAELKLVRGLPGSGKTTFAKTLTDYIHFETDMYFCLSGEYKWNGADIARAHRWCQSKVYEALKEGKKVVVSNTFTKKWEMEAYFEMAKELNIPISVETMTGNYPNIHGVSEEHIEKMRSRWEVI
jgi:ABC-type multidrug transport system ATPase subunit